MQEDSDAGDCSRKAEQVERTLVGRSGVSRISPSGTGEAANLLALSTFPAWPQGKSDLIERRTEGFQESWVDIYYPGRRQW